MYFARVDRERFIAEVRSSKEIPHVRSLHALTPDTRKPGLLIHYEITAKQHGEPIRLAHTEEIPVRADHTGDLAGSLLEQMQHEGLVYEVEIGGAR